MKQLSTILFCTLLSVAIISCGGSGESSVTPDENNNVSSTEDEQNNNSDSNNETDNTLSDNNSDTNNETEDNPTNTEELPEAPTAPTITAGDTILSLSWSAVSGASSYKVFYNTSDDSSTATQITSEVKNTNFTISGLINGTTYYIWLKAQNSSGLSPFSSSVTATPQQPLTVPTVIESVSITPKNNRLELTWTPVSEAASYEIWYYTSNNLSGSIVQSGGTITQTNHTISGLSNGTIYYVWLRAQNSVGTSNFGPVASGTPVLTTPLPTEAPSLTSGDQKIDVSWSSVIDATEYEVYYNTVNNSSTATKVNTDSDVSDTVCEITGLTNGETYYVWIITKNSAGSSDFSTASTITVSPNYTVTYTANGGTGSDITITIQGNTSINLQDCTFSRLGYTFQNWHNGTTTFSAGSSYTVTGDVTFSAQWTTCPTYTITYHDESGTTSISYNTGTTVTLPTNSSTKSIDSINWIFKEWQDSSNNPVEQITVTADIDVYAEYTPIGATGPGGGYIIAYSATGFPYTGPSDYTTYNLSAKGIPETTTEKYIEIAPTYSDSYWYSWSIRNVTAQSSWDGTRADSTSNYMYNSWNTAVTIGKILTYEPTKFYKYAVSGPYYSDPVPQDGAFYEALNANINGTTGWYVPATADLKLLYQFLQDHPGISMPSGEYVTCYGQCTQEFGDPTYERILQEIVYDMSDDTTSTKYINENVYDHVPDLYTLVLFRAF